MTIVDWRCGNIAVVRVLGVLLVGVAAMACFGKPAAPVENAKEPWTPPPPIKEVIRASTADRPALDVSWATPEFHNELRWPLSGMNHPALEPQFPIAQELAVGVDWEQLCARGVHNRVSATQQELLRYLRGWCDVAKRDVDAACANLTPLLGSVKSRLRPAVRHDLANILVEHGNADKAEHWLSKHRIRDPQILDLLAANYVELGAEADAFTINRRVMDSDDHASEATTCMRLTKRIVLGLDHDVSLHAQRLKKMVVNAKAPDPTCERLWNKVACWRDRSACAGYFNDENISPQMRLLVDSYNEWPGRATSADWWIYADTARLALPAPGAADLVVTAMEAALMTSAGCTGAMAVSFNHIIWEVRRAPDGAPHEERLKRVEKACPAPELLLGPQAPNAKQRPVASWPTSPTP